MTPESRSQPSGGPNPDPFALTANPALYVSRPATDRALAALVGSVRDGRITALCGPPGLGKTLLLHLVAERFGSEMRTVYLPYAALSTTELCAVILRNLEAPDVEDPEQVVRAYLAHVRDTNGEPLLLRVDDASAMPLPTTRWLGDLARACRGALRLVVAATDGGSTGRFFGALGSEVTVVRLIEPMTEAETHRYVSDRLASAGVADDVRERFDERTVSKLHAISGGIPRRLHAAGAAVLRGASPDVYAALMDETPPLPRETRQEAEHEEREAQVDELRRLRLSARRPPERRIEPPPPTRHVVLAVAGITVAIVLVGLLRGLVSAPLSPEDSLESEALVERARAPVAPVAEPGMPGEGEGAVEARAPAPAPAAEVAPIGPELPAVAPEPGAEAAPQAPQPVEPPARIAVPETPAREPAAAPTPKAVAAREGPAAAPARELEPEEPAPAPQARASEPRPEPEPAATPAGPVPVHVNATPWATIQVDGVDLGETPLAGVPLLAGTHTFRATMPDGRVIERAVDIDRDNRHIAFE